MIKKKLKFQDRKDNPIYKEFKNNSINEIKEKLKISDLKFIVDSEIIDKFS